MWAAGPPPLHFWPQAFFFLSSGKEELHFSLFTWLEIGALSLPFSFALDPLSRVMTLLITGVGSAIHIYSAGYMAKDSGLARYFAFLNFFVFNMLLLCTASHLPLLFAGWEGVGLCSYFLIGFWRKDSLNIKSSMIAFITNRIGDAFFVLGLFFIFSRFQTLDFQKLNALALLEGPQAFFSPISLGALFLFFGAMAKSAQMPLHVWLSWAMAGPTPVSALIHAATMVTAGVYLIARLFALYAIAPDVLNLMGWIGGATALTAALSAAAAWDLKKILAYSTVSQLGYMFMALSVKAFPAAVFHLLTHGIFKALLFLSAGSLIHGFAGERDIRKMGGARRFFPWTFPAWLAGALSLTAIPPFAGFFSKDEILWPLFAGGEKTLWTLALCASMLTAFYMTRATWMIFFAPISSKQKTRIPHESPGIMTRPLIFLSALTLIAGFLGMPHAIASVLPFHPPHVMNDFLSFWHIEKFQGSLAVEWGALILSLSLSVNTVIFSAYYFSKRGGLKSFPLLEKGFYADHVMHAVFIKPFQSLSRFLSVRAEEGVQKTVPLFSKALLNISAYLKFLQRGGLNRFALFFAAAAAVLLQMIFIR